MNSHEPESDQREMERLEKTGPLRFVGINLIFIVMTPVVVFFASLPVIFLAFFPIHLIAGFFGLITLGAIFTIPVLLLKRALGYEYRASTYEFINFILQLAAIICLYTFSRTVGDIFVFFKFGKLFSGVEPNPFIVYAYIIFGGFSTVLFCLYTLMDFIWRSRQLRQVENLPTSTVRGAALGLVELKGRIEPAPESDSPFILTSNGTASPFYLEDGTGRVLVDPRGCKCRYDWYSDLVFSIIQVVFELGAMLGLREVVLRRRKIAVGFTDYQYVVKPGDELYVIGTLEENPDAPAGATGAERLIVRSRKRASKGEGLVHVVFGGLDYLNTFFIADSGEETALKFIRYGRRMSLVIGAFFAMGGLFVLMEGIWGGMLIGNGAGL